MHFLLIAQVAKMAIVWTANHTAKKVLRTIVCASIGAAILDREHKRRQAYEQRYS